MTICLVCGNDNPPTNKFCQECGTPLQPAEPTVQEIQQEVSSTNTVQIEPEQLMEQVEQPTTTRREASSKKMSTKKKVLVSSLLTVAVILLVSHLLIKNAIDPYKQLSEANRAFAAKDASTFMEYFDLDDDIISDKDSLYQYMKDEDWTDYISPEIKKMIQQVESGQYPKPYKDSYGNNLISVVDEKYLLFYKKVKVQLEPVNVSASSSIDLTDITFGDDKTATLKDAAKKIGKFTPGTHSFNVKLKDDFSEQTVAMEKEIIGEGENKSNIYFDFDDQTLSLESDYSDAIIFIDGKSTDKKAEDLTIYTVPLDGSVEIHAEYDGKKSETVKVTDTYVHIPFEDVQKKMKEQELQAKKEEAIADFKSEYEDSARDLFYNFRDDYYYAVSNGDFSYVSDYFADGTQLKDDYRKFVIDHNDFDFSYNYDFISNDISNLVAVNENTFQLFSYEVFDFFTSTDDNWHYERQKKYTLKLINGDLKITGLEDSATVKKERIN